MIFVGPTLLILSLLALNHAIHGPACLGLQPGGESTANLFWLQVLVSLTACCWGRLPFAQTRELPRTGFDGTRVFRCCNRLDRVRPIRMAALDVNSQSNQR